MELFVLMLHHSHVKFAPSQTEETGVSRRDIMCRFWGDLSLLSCGMSEWGNHRAGERRRGHSVLTGEIFLPPVI